MSDKLDVVSQTALFARAGVQAVGRHRGGAEMDVKKGCGTMSFIIEDPHLLVV